MVSTICGLEMTAILLPKSPIDDARALFGICAGASTSVVTYKNSPRERIERIERIGGFSRLVEPCDGFANVLSGYLRPGGTSSNQCFSSLHGHILGQASSMSKPVSRYRRKELLPYLLS